MEQKNQITVNGVVVVFQISLRVGTVISSPPTEFIKNYFKTLARMAGDHFIEQMTESIIERINEDFKQFKKEKPWPQSNGIE